LNYVTSTLNFCCTTPPPQGFGNITKEPVFVDAANGDLRLQSTSPCIDAGNTVEAYGITDLDGKPRVLGAAVDMGAYEFGSPGPPSITQQPRSLTVNPGSNVTFRVKATGSSPLFYKWLLNGAAIPNATNWSLLVPSATTNDAGGYSVVITNALGSATSQVAVLTVRDGVPGGFAPVITLQPVGQSVYAGSDVTFTAAANGSLPLTWQWFFNGIAVSAATNSSLTLTAVATTKDGLYSVTVTNAFGKQPAQKRD
jgi:hypothetical protein